MPREVFVTMRVVMTDGVNELYKANEIECMTRNVDGVLYVRTVNVKRGHKMLDQPDGDYDD